MLQVDDRITELIGRRVIYVDSLTFSSINGGITGVKWCITRIKLEIENQGKTVVHERKILHPGNPDWNIGDKIASCQDKG
jgi:hypothetical protein